MGNLRLANQSGGIPVLPRFSNYGQVIIARADFVLDQSGHYLHILRTNHRLLFLRLCLHAMSHKMTAVGNSALKLPLPNPVLLQANF